MDIIDYKDSLLKEFYLDDITIDDNYPNIKKWLRYSIFPCVDADNQLKSEDILNKLGWIKNGTLYIDCIFSFKTYFNMFLRVYNSNAAKSHPWLLLYFDNIFSNDKIDEFCKNNMDISKSDFIKCLDQIELFAKNTNTLGNYMVCPDNKYNDIKGRRGYLVFNDRIELILQALKYKDKNSVEIKLINSDNSDRSDNWTNWFNENIRNFCLEDLFEGKFSDLDSSKIKDCFLKFPIHNKKIKNSYRFEPYEIKKYTKYLYSINKWIEERAAKIEELIKINNVNTERTNG